MQWCADAMVMPCCWSCNLCYNSLTLLMCWCTDAADVLMLLICWCYWIRIRNIWRTFLKQLASVKLAFSLPSIKIYQGKENTYKERKGESEFLKYGAHADGWRVARRAKCQRRWWGAGQEKTGWLIAATKMNLANPDSRPAQTPSILWYWVSTTQWQSYWIFVDA